MNATATATKTPRKNDLVTLLNDASTGIGYTAHVVPAGTKCYVAKSARNGKITIFVLDQTSRYRFSPIYVTKDDLAIDAKPKANINKGDIYFSTWGYEQTNVDFYRIIDVLPNSVRYVELNNRRVSVDHNGMSGTVVPDVIADDVVRTSRLRVDGNGNCGFKPRSYCTATKWDGEPVCYSEWH